MPGSDQHRHRQLASGISTNPASIRTFYNFRERDLDEVFPLGSHIDVGIHKKFLREDYLMSIKRETRVDCRDKCFACGILPKFAKERSTTEEMAWECPPVTPISERKRARQAAIPLSAIG